ncbi:MAG: acyl-CoA/acyl-ACP dehydrogenase [Pseudomonadales bacterium]|nr:acyl-CoA/acyl-ACP dehydrogenase [Pseudomonadales bacterium]
MRFGLSEEQTMLGDMLNKYLEAESSLDVIRESCDNTPHHNEKIWSGLLAQGAHTILIPEEYGGAGLSMLHSETVSEVLGKHIAPVSYLSNAVLSPLAITLAASDSQKELLLPGLASGDVSYGIGLTDAIVNRENTNLEITNGKVNGVSTFVIGGQTADKLILGKPGTLLLVDSNAEGVTIKPMITVDKTRDFAVVTLENAPCEVLGKEGSAAQAMQKLLNAGRISIAADTMGAADAMFNQALEYSKERFQFDRPIGSFQSIKHIFAEMVTELEPCRSLLWYAAHAFDEIEDEATLLACHSKAHIAEVAKTIGRATTELHGGMGFTDLLGLHFWFKRIEVNRQLLGGPEIQRHFAAVVQGWAPEAITAA